jgi:hypothetical protein
MIARSSVVAYTLKRRPANDYVVEHKGSHAHLAGERCAICDRQKGIPRATVGPRSCVKTNPGAKFFTMILEFYDISTRERPQAHVPLPPEATLDDVFNGDAKLKALLPHIVRVDIDGVERKQWRGTSPGKHDKVVVHVLPNAYLPTASIGFRSSSRSR